MFFCCREGSLKKGSCFLYCAYGQQKVVRRYRQWFSAMALVGSRESVQLLWHQQVKERTPPTFYFLYKTHSFIDPFSLLNQLLANDTTNTEKRSSEETKRVTQQQKQQAENFKRNQSCERKRKSYKGSC